MTTATLERQSSPGDWAGRCKENSWERIADAVFEEHGLALTGERVRQIAARAMVKIRVELERWMAERADATDLGDDHVDIDLRNEKAGGAANGAVAKFVHGSAPPVGRRLAETGGKYTTAPRTW